MRLENDDPKRNNEGNDSSNSFKEPNLLFSSGNSKVKKRKAVGIIPAAAKPILPKNSLRELSSKK
jgi:hypothetical protein